MTTAEKPCTLNGKMECFCAMIECHNGGTTLLSNLKSLRSGMSKEAEVSHVRKSGTDNRTEVDRK